ncbi:MAG: DUF2846 domain-containing protein [Rubrivivax sp.]|nr:DUF2846 domain-containing protein [Pyrinomonadaceae bacterium]
MARYILQAIPLLRVLLSARFKSGKTDDKGNPVHTKYRLPMKRVCFLAILLFAMPLIVIAQEQHGTVYFYRGRDTEDFPKEINELNPEAVVYLDAKEFMSMPEQTFMGFQIPVGQYVLSMKRKGTSRPLKVEAGKTYYLHVEQKVYPYAYQIIYDVEEKSALDAIRRCYALKEKKIKLKQFAVISIKPGTKKKS